MTKYALITGASSGIGYNLALQFAKKGYKVFGCAPEQYVKDMDPLKEFGVVPFALDITDVSQIQRAVEFFKSETGGEKLDVLYNNAGIAIGGPGFVFDDSQLANFINVNLVGHMYMTKYFADFVINAKGTIVYTASVAAIVPLAWTSIYCASKAAIDAYARGIRVELAPFGVTVHSVITGGVRTAIALTALGKMPESVLRYKYSVPGFEESMYSTLEMTNDGMLPDVYAKRIVGRLLKGHNGFNIYEGFQAGILRFVSRWVPLWLQYKIIGHHFKQDKVWKNTRKVYNE